MKKIIVVFFLSFFLSCKKETGRPDVTASIIHERWSPDADFSTWRVQVKTTSPVPYDRAYRVDWGFNQKFDWKYEIVLPANKSEVTVDSYMTYEPDDTIDYLSLKEY